MKKKLLFVSMVVAGLSGFAQLDSIKNPSFNAWSGGNPTNWGTTNTISAGGVTEGTAGNAVSGSAIMVTTTTVVGPTTVPGMAASNGTISVVGLSGLVAKGGFPFRMRPTTLTFDAKYTSSSGSDNGVVQVILTKWNGTSRDTLGISRAFINNTVSSYAQQILNIDYSNSPLGGSPTTITHYVGNKSVAPDTALIIVSSLSGNTGAINSTLFVDNLEFEFSCDLDPTIITSGTDPQNAPYVDNDTIITVATAGAPFSFSFTSYIPKEVIISAPLLGSSFSSTITTIVDSIQTTSNELSGSAASFMSVDADQFNNTTGGNAISCVSFSGTIPASPANAIYNLIITPLMWGTPTGASVSNVGRLVQFPSPQTITLYIKVGAGSDTITDAPNDSLHWKTMEFNGETRRYSVYVPTIYDGTDSVPLLFNVHGWTGSSTKQMNFEDFRPIADTANFIIVHPEALGAIPSWDLTGTSDTDWLMFLLDSLERKYNIDTNRVYSTGFSQGGLMSYNFGCSFSDKFAAIAPVSGGMTNPTTCKPSHYMPTLHIHGTEDPLGPYSAVQAALNRMVAINKCDATHSTTTIANLTDADSSTAELWVYDNGMCGSRVEHYKVINGGHECPVLDPNKKNNYGVGFRNNDFEGVVKIWQFLSQYRLDELCSINWTTGIDENAPENSVSVYPNPSNGSFTFEATNYNGSKVQVFNVLGTLVVETELTGITTVINLENAAKGVYLYKVQNQDGVKSSGKLIIQ